MREAKCLNENPKPEQDAESFIRRSADAGLLRILRCSPGNTQAAVAALNGVRPVLSHFDTPRSAEDLAADVIDLWVGAEAALQALLGNATLSGQQLVRAARQSELITIDQAHALLEFLAARDRANRTSYKPTQTDGDAAVDGFRALESALTGTAPAAAKRRLPAAPCRPPTLPAPASPYSPPSRRHRLLNSRHPLTPRRAPADCVSLTCVRRLLSGGPPTVELPPPAYTSANAGRGNIEHALEAAETKRRRMPNIPLWALIGIPVLLILLSAAGSMFGRAPVVV